MRGKFACTCAACVLVLFGVAAMHEGERVQNPEYPQATVEQIRLPAPEQVQSAAAPGEAEVQAPDGGGYYVLKAYMEKLAVYRVYPDGTRALADIIDMNIYVLPDADVQSLKDGIVLRNEDALIRILEDFMS